MADMVLAAWQRKSGKSWAMVWAIILEVKTHDKLLILKQKSPFGQYGQSQGRRPQSYVGFARVTLRGVWKSYHMGLPIYYFQISGSGIMIINKAKTLHNPRRYQPLTQLSTIGNRQFSNCQSLPIHDPDASKPTKRASKFFLSHMQNIA